MNIGSLCFHLFVPLIFPFHFIGYVQGAELDAQEGKGAAALAACRTLAEELTELRFPAPRILAFKVYSFLIKIMHSLMTKQWRFKFWCATGRKFSGSVFCFPADTCTQGPSL